MVKEIDHLKWIHFLVAIAFFLRWVQIALRSKNRDSVFGKSRTPAILIQQFRGYALRTISNVIRIAGDRGRRIGAFGSRDNVSYIIISKFSFLVVT